MSSQSPAPQGLDISQLDVQQLSQVKKQLDDELEHLTNSYQKLRNAQAKFRDCTASLQRGLSGKDGGTMSNPSRVIRRSWRVNDLTWAS